jgi:Holliday junction resolvasome RuvABC endonuclease subunit
MSSFLGIDPGASGGIAVVGDRCEAHKMPETLRDILDLILALKARHDIRFALLEELHAMPAAVEEKLGIKRGSISMWKLGAHYGALKMALTAAGIRFDERVPAVWQKIMCCRTGGNKNISKARAQQLFPDLKITHHIADALLIASTARVLWLNANPTERAARAEAPMIHYPVPQVKSLFDPMETI